jgi:Flp pilus assembly protein TadG
MNAPRRNHDLGERGVVIITLALFMLLMLGFVALGVDIAKLMATRSQLQNAADAAALAGASAIDPTTGVIVRETAVARAQQTGILNSAFVGVPQPVSVDAADVVTTSSTCKVTARREGQNAVITYFARVLGISSLGLNATATARVDTVRSVLCGIAPLAAVPPEGSTFKTGESYALKLPAGAGGGGQYHALDLPRCSGDDCGGGGASRFRCLLEKGSCCPMSIGQTVNTQPGNMSGPTRDGVIARFNNDTVTGQDISYSQYQAAGGNGSRVVVVPITTPASGNGPVGVLGFGTFFLKNIPGNGSQSEIDGEFIYATVAGVGGGSGPGALSFAVRLVR